MTAVSYQALQRLEAGKSKNPEPELLKALAKLYAVPYQELVNQWVGHVFGTAGDLIRHDGDQQSGLPSQVGDAHDSAAARMELQELRTLVERYETEARQVRTVTDSLVKVAIALETVRKAPKGKPSSGRRDRKVG